MQWWEYYCLPVYINAIYNNIKASSNAIIKMHAWTLLIISANPFPGLCWQYREESYDLIKEFNYIAILQFN